jgi:preprotein translocase subunit SecE
MMQKSPIEFGREVRREVSKVTWPSRKETVVTTIMVFIMVILAALFFLLVDQVMSFGVRQIFSVGG